MGVPLVRPRIVALIAAVIVVAGGLGGFFYWYAAQGGGHQVGSRGDGPSLYGALDQVNVSVNSLSGGPWELFAYVGFAAQALFSPVAVGFFSTNLSLRYCGSQFNGVTLWNSTSIPTFSGTIDSGTAPFWQFEFYSATTRDIVLATDISGVARAYSPMPPTDPCWGYAGGPVAPSYVSWVNPLPNDTPIQAMKGFQIAGQSFESKNSPIIEEFVNGYTPLALTGHGPNGGVQYTRCGIVGVAGAQPFESVGFLSSGQVQSIISGTESCSPVYNLTSNPVMYVPYTIRGASIGQPTYLESGLSAEVYDLQVSFPTGIQGGPSDDDAWGLSTWAVSPAWSNLNHSMPPSTPLSCQGWVSSPTQCVPEGVGWSLILLSANGSWLSSFPSSSGSSGWSVPNAPVVTGEQLMITYPSSWSVAEASLLMTGSAPVPTVGGNIEL